MIHQSDVWIREAILLGLEDLRKNIWLMDDILADFTCSPYLRPKYEKQIQAAKEWFLNNNIEVNMTMQPDQDRLPCVSIHLGSSVEKPEMKTMADSSTEKVKLLPNTIGKPIPYVIKPFDVTGYNSTSGIATVDLDMDDFSGVSAGMILVNSIGQGYVIQEITPDGINIGVDQQFTAGKYGIVPKFQYYEARIEHTFMQEQYTIGCHVHGDMQALLWLHSIVLYAILRYRESLLEANGFTESVVSSSELQEGIYFNQGAEKSFSRFITLDGQVENSWIKTPRRFIEAIELKEKVGDGFVGGIKILSNRNASDFLDISKETWYTIDENEDDDSNN